MLNTTYHCAWLGHQNLGDEVMWRAYVHLYGERGPHMLAGGTLINRGDGLLADYLAACEELGKIIPPFGCGVADPSFWTGRAGWTDRRREWAALLSRLAVVGVRGPRSRDLLEEVGLTKVRVVGDPAILFHRNFNPGRPKTRRIAINIGGAREMRGSKQDLLDTLSVIARGLEGLKREVHIIPAWSEDVPLCEKLACACKHAILHPLDLDPARVVDALAECNIAITVKLHAAVLAACANTPFIALEYRPKVRDFARSIGWERFGHLPDKIDPDILWDHIGALLTRLRDAREELDAATRALKARFLEYADSLRQ